MDSLAPEAWFAAIAGGAIVVYLALASMAEAIDHHTRLSQLSSEARRLRERRLLQRPQVDASQIPRSGEVDVIEAESA